MDKNLRLYGSLKICGLILILCLALCGCEKNDTRKEAEKEASDWVSGWFYEEELPKAKSVVCYTKDDYYVFEVIHESYSIEPFTGEIDEDEGIVTQKSVVIVFTNGGGEGIMHADGANFTLDETETYGGGGYVENMYKDVLKNYETKYVYSEAEIKNFVHAEKSYKKALEEEIEKYGKWWEN